MEQTTKDTSLKIYFCMIKNKWTKTSPLNSILVLFTWPVSNILCFSTASSAYSNLHSSKFSNLLSLLCHFVSLLRDYPKLSKYKLNNQAHMAQPCLTRDWMSNQGEMPATTRAKAVISVKRLYSLQQGSAHIVPA